MLKRFMEVSKEVGKAELIDRLLKMKSPKHHHHSIISSQWHDTKQDSLVEDSISVNQTDRSAVIK